MSRYDVFLACAVLGVALNVAAPNARAESAAEELQRGVALFEDAHYTEAQAVLMAVDNASLNAQQKSTLERYRGEVRLAVNLSNRAQQDYDEAERAMRAGDTERALVLYDGVIRNQYAAASLKEQALEGRAKAARSQVAQSVPRFETVSSDGASTGSNTLQLSDFQSSPFEDSSQQQQRRTTSGAQSVQMQPAGSSSSRPRAASTPPRSTPTPVPTFNTTQSSSSSTGGGSASSLVSQGRSALQSGNYDEAARNFRQALDLDPGNPDATLGLEQALQHQVVREQSGSMIDRTLQARSIQWQRTEATYRQLERDVQTAVSDDDFDKARELALRARQVVETGRADAEPVSKYESLREEADGLVNFVEMREAAYNADETSRKQAEAQGQEEARRQQVEDSRQRRVDALFDQAVQLRREKRYEEAIQSLTQITRIEPSNERAEWLIEDLNTLVDLQRQSYIDKEQDQQLLKAVIDADESAIPYSQDIMYPKNWPEITERRLRYGANQASDSGINRAARRRLDETLGQVNITGIDLKAALENIRDENGLNLHVKWPTLASAGISPETPVAMKLHDIRLSKVLDILLADAGGAKAELGYEVDDGVVTVSTREDLNRRTVTRVYNIRDVLASAPNFKAPEISLGAQQHLAMDRHRASRTKSFFDATTGDNEDDSEEGEDAPHRKAAVDDLLDLIRTAIEPGTWREQGGMVGSLRELNGQLIVTHTSATQNQVGGLLGQLRETRAVQIAVEARFLTVGTNFLEDLGIDFDVIFNQGNAGYDVAQVLGPDGLPITAIDPATGSNILIPREFSRLGLLPQPPGGTAGFDPLTTFQQPYVQPGTVPAAGNVAPHSGKWSPVPVISNVLALTDPSNIDTGIPGSFGGDPALLPALQVFGSFLDNIQVDFLVRATQADSRSTVLQAPKITLSNGQRAYVAVVTQTSYVSGLNAVVAEEVGQLEPIVSTLNTGSVLDVEATVSADRRYVTITVRAGLAQLISLDSFAVNVPGTFSTGVGASIQIPVLSLTTVRSTVTVPDGGTLLVGGQKLTGEIETESGVPVLSKLPVLKRLYTARSTVKDENVLLILIKPKIIIQPEAEEDAFPGLYEGGE